MESSSEKTGAGEEGRLTSDATGARRLTGAGGGVATGSGIITGGITTGAGEGGRFTGAGARICGT